MESVFCASIEHKKVFRTPTIGGQFGKTNKKDTNGTKYSAVLLKQKVASVDAAFWRVLHYIMSSLADHESKLSRFPYRNCTPCGYFDYKDTAQGLAPHTQRVPLRGSRSLAMINPRYSKQKYPCGHTPARVFLFDKQFSRRSMKKK